MNQIDPNQMQQPNSTPPQPGQPQMQPPPMQPQSQPPMNSPFEMPNQAPSPQMSQDQNIGFEPMGAEQPKKLTKSWILIIVLVVILILGGVVFAAWAGWINVGFLNTLLGKNTPAATTTTPVVTKASNDTVRKTDLSNLKDALKKYYQANQVYPISETVDKTSNLESVLKVLVPTYIATLPVDPVSTQYYGYQSDGKSYSLTAVLDDATDPSATKIGSYYVYKVTDSSVETPTTSTSTTTSGTDTTTSTSTDTLGGASGSADASASSSSSSSSQ